MATKTQQLYDKLFGSNKQYNTYSFPSDLETVGSKNVMIININTVEGSRASTKSNVRYVEGDQPVYQQKGSGSLVNQVTKTTRRINTAIALYMPNNIASSYGGDWSATELGSLGMLASTGATVSEAQGMSGARDLFNREIKNLLAQQGINLAAGAASSVGPVDLKSIKGIVQKQIDNPFMEVMFNGVKNRSFSFTFKMIPRNEAESKVIKQITDTLKYHSAPEIKQDTANNYWLYPSEFDITFLHKNAENPYLFKISTCALTDVTVNHSGDAYFATFDNGAPFQTELTLNFLELEVLTKQRIEQGF